MRPKIRTRRARDGQAQQRAMARTIDEIAAYEQFKQEILPALRADLAAGRKPAELREKYSAMLTARAITIALSDSDAGKAMTAIRDLQDRHEGKAKETKEISHRLKDLPEEQLDAVLDTKMRELAGETMPRAGGVYREPVEGEAGYIPIGSEDDGDGHSNA